MKEQLLKITRKAVKVDSYYVCVVLCMILLAAKFLMENR